MKTAVTLCPFALIFFLRSFEKFFSLSWCAFVSEVSFDAFHRAQNIEVVYKFLFTACNYYESFIEFFKQTFQARESQSKLRC